MNLLVKYVYQNCEIEIGGKILMGDLNVLDMINFDLKWEHENLRKRYVRIILIFLIILVRIQTCI